MHVIPSVGPLRGGPSQVLRTTVGALADAGVSVDVVTTDDNGPNRLSVKYGWPTREHSSNFWYFPRQAKFYSFSWPLAKWLRKHVTNYDVLHIHALFSFPSTVAGLLSSSKKVPYLIRPLGTLNSWGLQHRRPRLKRASLTVIEAGLLCRAAFVHFTAEDEELQATSLGLPFRGIVIPNIVEGSSSTSLSPVGGGETFEILFLSRIDPKKGLDLLLEAFREVYRSAPRVRLTIAGSGDAGFVDSMRRKASSFGIDGAVRWIGFVEGSEKQQLLAESDVFVLPSYSENFGMAVTDAMAAGLPIVISDAVALHSLISREHAGIVVKCSARQISSAILRLHAQPALRQELSRKGRELVLTHFSSRSIAQSLISCYEAALKHI